MAKEIDERAKELGLTRSAYIQMLIRRDLQNKGKDFVIRVEDRSDSETTPS